VQRLSVSPVQTAMEASLQLAFEDAVILSRHAGRATVMSDDWWTGLELRSMRGDDPLLNGLQRRSLFISLYFIYVSTLSFCCLCALPREPRALSFALSSLKAYIFHVRKKR